MKPRTAQLSVRKNPDSPRVHGLRLIMSTSALRQHGTPQRMHERQQAPIGEPLSAEIDGRGGQGTTRGENTGEGHLLDVQEVARLLQVPVSWVYEHTRPRCVAPLPHVKLGKYLRFFLADLKDYLEDVRSFRGVLR